MTPCLTIISRPSFGCEVESFLDREGFKWRPSNDASEAESLIEFCGRTCYLSFDPNPKSDLTTRQYIEKLINNGHESVLEHAQWTFILDGVTRGFSHQLVRHRVGFAFSQLSQQYHDEREAHFIEPRELARDPSLRKKWKTVEQGIQDFYSAALHGAQPHDGISTREATRYARSFARSLLPNATRTVICVSANARALRHFLTVRGNLDGDLEMRLVSEKIYDLLHGEAPSTVFDYHKHNLSDGTVSISKINQRQG